MKLSIRYKLLLGFSLVLVLSYLPQTMSFLTTEKTMHEQIQNIQSETAQNAVNQIQNFLTQIQLDLLGVSRQFARSYRNDPTTNLNQVMEITTYTLQQNPYLRRIAILSTDGKEIIKIDRYLGQTPEPELNYIIPTDSFNQAILGKTTISKVYTSPYDLAPQFDLYVPVFSEDQIIAVIKSQVKLDHLWDIVAEIKVGDKGLTYVVDDEGQLIAHPDSSLLQTTPNLINRSVIQTIINNPNAIQGNFRYINEHETPVIATGAIIPQIGWRVIVEQPIAEAFSQISISRTLFFGAIVVSAILLIAISLFLSANLTQPISKLKKVAEELQRGNYLIRAQANSINGDEIDSLANTFNSMLDEITEKLTILSEQKKRLDNDAKLLLRRDFELQGINTELEQERDNITAERNKMAVVVAGIHDAVIAVDLNHRITLFNTASENITGYKSVNAISMPINQLITVQDENGDISVDQYCPIRTDEYEGVTFSRPNLRLIGKDGKTAFVALTSGKIRESLSADLGTIITLHDVTEERKLEEMKLDFVSMAAHELRTPLTSIYGYLNMFIDENSKTLTTDQLLILNRINISTQQLNSLVENLLNVSKIERGAINVTQKPMDWLEIVDSVVEGFKYRAKDKSIKLTFNKPNHAIPKVQVDQLRISEILGNLISNAINYTPTKGQVTVSVETNGHEVITHIKDTGIGIPQDALPHLFNKFFRVSGVLEQGSKGTGLGLYISKAIIEMHHGKIWAESELGKGSTFSFSLPTET